MFFHLLYCPHFKSDHSPKYLKLGHCLFLSSIAVVIYNWCAKMDYYPFHSLASYFFLNLFICFGIWALWTNLCSFILWSSLSPLHTSENFRIGFKIFLSSKRMLPCHQNRGWWFHNEAWGIHQRDGRQKMRNTNWELKRRRISFLIYGATAYHLLTYLRFDVLFIPRVLMLSLSPAKNFKIKCII